MPSDNDLAKCMTVLEHTSSKKVVKFRLEKCTTECKAALHSENIQIWAATPPHDDHRSRDSLIHGENYQKLIECLRQRKIVGPKQLEYIFSQGECEKGKLSERDNDKYAEACKEDLMKNGANLFVFKHFGLFKKEGTMQNLESSAGDRPKDTGGTGDGSGSSEIASARPERTQTRSDRPQFTDSMDDEPKSMDVLIDGPSSPSAGKQKEEQDVDPWGSLNAKHGRNDAKGKTGSWGKVSISTMHSSLVY